MVTSMKEQTQQLCIDLHRNAEHLRKRFHKDQYDPADIMANKVCLNIARHVLIENGLYGEYEKMLDFMADLHEAENGVKQ